MTNEELTRKIQQLRNDGDDSFADAIADMFPLAKVAAALNLTAEKISSRDEILASVAELKDSMTEQEKADLHAVTLGLASEGTGKTDNPKGFLENPPNPFESAEDSRALVAWLAADSGRWHRFINEWERVLIGCDADEEVIDLVREAFTSPLPERAEAAWKAIAAEHSTNS